MRNSVSQVNSELSPMNGLIRIARTNDQQRKVDVIFVHGLGGDAKSSWHPIGHEEKFWPDWLAQDFPLVGFWSLGYASSATKWKEESMPIADRGTNILEQLSNDGLGDRPLVFICHSMGGIVVKQLLRHAQSFGVPRWNAIARQVKGIAFIATPHGGTGLAEFADFAKTVLRTNEQLAELIAHHPRLRELHGWFLHFQRNNQLVCRSYFETRELRPEVFGLKVPKGIIVVSQGSAEPDVVEERAIPIDEDHIGICKPDSKEAPLYKSIVVFIKDILKKLE